MTTTTKYDPWIEYDMVAESMAKQGLLGAIGDPLPPLLSVPCLALINEDPEAFERRVSGFAYALAMNARSEKAFHEWADQRQFGKGGRASAFAAWKAACEWCKS